MVSRRHHPPSGWFICCALILILLEACSTNASTSSPLSKGSSPMPPAATAARVAPLGAAGCQPPSPLDAAPQGLPEAQGTASGVQLWALFFTEMPVHSRQEIKIVWRMTGDGNLHLVAVGPGGRGLSPDWMQAHGGSNWQRPGQEWGSSFTFPVTGCWDLHASRGASSGDVWLVVH